MNSYMSTVSADNTQGQDLLRLLNQQGMQQQRPQEKCIESMQQQQQQQNQDMYVTMMQQLQQRRMNFPSLINSSTISTTTNIHQPTTSGATSVEPSASLTTSSNNGMATNCITTSTSNASDINIHDIMALRSIEHTNELMVQKLESLRQGNVANPIDMHQHLNDKSNHPNTNDKSFSNITSTTSSQLPGKSEQPGSNSTSSPSKSPSR